jgi:hypothetical protein
MSTGQQITQKPIDITADIENYFSCCANIPCTASNF